MCTGEILWGKVPCSYTPTLYPLTRGSSTHGYWCNYACMHVHTLVTQLHPLASSYTHTTTLHATYRKQYWVKLVFLFTTGRHNSKFLIKVVYGTTCEHRLRVALQTSLADCQFHLSPSINDVGTCAMCIPLLAFSVKMGHQHASHLARVGDTKCGKVRMTSLIPRLPSFAQ